MSSPDDASDVLDRLRASDADYVKVAVTDIDGILRGKYLDKQKFLASAESGFGFCNVVFGWDSSDECYDNVGVHGLAEWVSRRRGAHRPVDPPHHPVGRRSRLLPR